MSFRLIPFTLVVLVAAVVLWGAVARAQTSLSLSVSPEKFELSLSRGQVFEDEIRIANRSEVVMPIHLSVVRWDARDEVGGINFTASPEDASFDIIQWIALDEVDFILEPGEARTVPVTITVPGNAEPGGKYGTVFVEPNLPGLYFEEGAARVLPRIGILFLVDIPLIGLEGPIEPKVSIEEFGVPGRSSVLSAVASRIASLFRQPLRAFAESPPVSVDVFSAKPAEFTLRVRNDGITHVRPFGRMTIHNLFGVEVADAEIPPTTILPGKVRRFPVELAVEDVPILPKVIEHQLALGRYRAIIVLEGVGEEPLLEVLSYWIFPWQGILALLFVLIPAGFVTFRMRYRIATALKILVRGRKE